MFKSAVALVCVAVASVSVAVGEVTCAECFEECRQYCPQGDAGLYLACVVGCYHGCAYAECIP